MTDTKNNSSSVGDASAVGDLLPLSSIALDTEALLNMGEARATKGFAVHDDGSQTLLLGEHIKPHHLPALNPKLPDFVTAAEVVVEPASFIDYIIIFKSSTAICKASLGQNRIDAILDYHGKARAGEGDAARDAAVPQRLQHTVTLVCPFDRDYEKWRRAFTGERKFDQRELAEFLEDMIHTINEPAAADLLEAVADLKIDRAVRFKSARNERNGNVSFAYEEIDSVAPTQGQSGQGVITVPDSIVVVVPIFQGANPVLFNVKLRYALDKGVLVFRFAVPGLDNEERIAFRSIGEKVREDTDTPVFYVK